MKSIDREIFDVGQRIRRRESAIKHTATEARERALRTLVSPLSLVGALALGFVVASMVGRGKRATLPERRRAPPKKALGLGGVAMAGASWIVRSQFGGPVGLANFVLDKVRSRRPAP